MANYTLTSLKDTIAGSTLSDNFNGNYDAISGVDTFNSVDVLDGQEGIDTLTINHFLNVAITPPDVLWSGLKNIEKVDIKTTGDGAQTITTGTAFEAAFSPAGIDLTTITTGAGAINITMISFTGIATLAATSKDGAQTIVTGSGLTEVTALSGAGSLNIKGVGLVSVSAITTGAGAQTIGDSSGNGKNLTHVTAESGGGAQTIISTSANAVGISAVSDAGRQTVITGNGYDNIFVATSAELNTISTHSGNDRIAVLSTSSGSYAINGGTGNDSIYGGAGSDYLIGDDGDDILDGRTGADSMTGGNGNDLYSVRSADDIVTETNALAATGGYDKVNSYLAAYILGGNIENGQVMSTGAANLTGNSLDNILYAGAGNNMLDGGLGNDSVSYYFSSAAIQVSLAATSVQATGGSGSDTLKNIENLAGSRYADVLAGNAGDNILNGGAGADTLNGGDGSDSYYVDNTGDRVVEINASDSIGGIDYVHSYTSAYTLGANVENGLIRLFGTASLTGNNLNNLLYAGLGNNTLDGAMGTDTVSYAYGASGTTGVTVSLATTATQATGSSGSDTLLSIENLIGSRYADTLTGSVGNNVLIGLAGSDTLNGGYGADTMDGGDGSDSYYVDNAGDQVVETNSSTSIGGIDHVHSYLSAYTLGANVENGLIRSSGTASLTGNNLDNVLYAGAGNNVFDGAAGTDTVSYRFATAGVTVSLISTAAQVTDGSGSDMLKNVENLIGSNYNDMLVGNTGNNDLNGGDGNDILNGSIGADTMIGGDGNDSYYVENAGDVVIEINASTSTGGIDYVHSYTSAYTLGANIENGDIRSFGTASLTGNSLDNLLYAGTGNNVLDGAAGTDTVSYAYGVSGTTGVTVSLATTGTQATGGSGSDTLLSIENLIGSGYADRLTGSAGANILIGGTGSDVLVGGAGADTMNGGDGNDSYYVDNAGDVVIEINATGGIDYVHSYLSTYTLDTHVENGLIRLSGAADLSGNSLNNVLYAGVGSNILNGGIGTDTVSYAYGVSGTAGVTVSLATTAAQATGSSGSDSLVFIENLTGSSYADTLTGSAGNNILSGETGDDILNGGDGNDVLIGGLGADTLTGGTGGDRFDFTGLTDMGLTSTTMDTITDFNTSEGDKINLQGVDANTALSGDQAFTFLGAISAFTGDATGQLRFDASAHMLYGSTDADTAAEFAIVLTGVSSLTGTDMLL